MLPTTKTRSQLYADGDLPSNALFSSEPPEPAYADITPATEPANLALVFARGFDAEKYLLRNAFRLAYLQDMQANPDGFWPIATTTGAPPATSAFAFRDALRRNDLRNFAPTTPTLLCGGRDDPVVFWLNTQALQTYWENSASPSPVTVLDVDAATTIDDPYEDVKRRFAVAKAVVRATAVAQGADDGGDEAVLEVYHAGLVAPFCIEAARQFFEEHG